MFLSCINSGDISPPGRSQPGCVQKWRVYPLSSSLSIIWTFIQWTQGLFCSELFPSSRHKVGTAQAFTTEDNTSSFLFPPERFCSPCSGSHFFSCSCNILRQHQVSVVLTWSKVREGNLRGFGLVTQVAPERSALCRVGAEYGHRITLPVYSPFPKAKKYLCVCWTHE